jgi:hypothetical protein
LRAAEADGPAVGCDSVVSGEPERFATGLDRRGTDDAMRFEIHEEHLHFRVVGVRYDDDRLAAAWRHGDHADGGLDRYRIPDRCEVEASNTTSFRPRCRRARGRRLGARPA